MITFFQTSFKILRLLLLVFSLHWLFVSVQELFILAEWKSWTIWFLIFFFLCIIAWRKHLYSFLMKHKFAIMAAVIIVQLLMLGAAEQLIRRDAGVVFSGAFKTITENQISSYLTRNPNNLPLFLYERFFYSAFGFYGLWVMQLLNMVYTDLTAWILYKGMKRHFDQAAADAVFSFYLLLIGFSPYFYSMYTDILPLPLIALQIFLALDIFKTREGLRLKKQSVYLGLLSALAVLVRPTTFILVLAFLLILFFKNQWKKFAVILSCIGLAFGLSYGAVKIAINHQKVVPLVKGEGLAKGPLLFIDLGLTDTGHNQEDMKRGLLQYVDPKKRNDYNNGMFKTENVIKDIQRRWKHYTWYTFLGHLYQKQSLTVAEGTLGWSYQDLENEKTPIISPLYKYTKHNRLAQFIRTYFLSIDKKEYQYYAYSKQVVWIVMALGLVAVFFYYKASDPMHFLSLAVFGGLLFLLIFEGGKTRYLIQFLPQILILSALGLTQYRQGRRGLP
ncbi:glycosyltransferase family 39 protein [Streptococcus macacae]|uniref:Membrane protein n=1 Tax=Streptococcus macacae NCTC 11558 TaxID=764298 RepID=G5JWK4_9STRE|nr:glycosyltransferase family 39 protein [Streptococcus macacae]EHJ53361.1 putative membrane protein [Streptococcus macacae NCTC 11558]SUN78786.1 integral membrane protein [Streptococcus macacae NCTC 11558]